MIIISIFISVRTQPSFILAGKRDIRRHSTTGFGENVMVTEQVIKCQKLSFSDRERA